MFIVKHSFASKLFALVREAFSNACACLREGGGHFQQTDVKLFFKLFVTNRT
jgi:hypothetical protein